MSALVERLRKVRNSTAEMAGHVDDWMDHDRDCVDVAEEAADRIEALETTIATRLKPALKLALEQAEDEGLWFDAERAPEAYLQRALRNLHDVIEGTPQE